MSGLFFTYQPMTNISHCVQQVMDMHTKFGLDYLGAPRHLSMSEEQFRSVCLHEELREFDDAVTKADKFDALLDLMVFTIGTMLRMGFPVDAGFQRVMAANMQKQVAMTASASKRDFELDLVKPADWVAPTLHDLVGERV